MNNHDMEIDKLDNIQKNIESSDDYYLIQQELEKFIYKCEAFINNNKCLGNLNRYIMYGTSAESVYSILKNKKKKHKKYIPAFEGIVFLIRNRKERHADDWHNVKRMNSFDIFDSYLTSCKNGVCPKITHVEHYCLTDISIDGYINYRAYYNNIERIGKDRDDTYYKACEKLNSVLDCTGNTDIDLSIFCNDCNQVNKEYSDQAKNRKAYWRHMSNPECDPVDNYCKSSMFISEQQRAIKNNDSDEYKKVILNNTNLANAFDLFRLCDIRRGMRNCCSATEA